jgi:hypothetical protein
MSTNSEINTFKEDFNLCGLDLTEKKNGVFTAQMCQQKPWRCGGKWHRHPCTPSAIGLAGRVTLDKYRK